MRTVLKVEQIIPFLAGDVRRFDAMLEFLFEIFKNIDLSDKRQRM